jgi:hypothetical protein
MKKLNHLSAALKGLGFSPESYLIKKLGRKYVEMATEEGLSGKFYGATEIIQEELFRWKIDTYEDLAKLLLKENPGTDLKQVESCLDSWTREYSNSIGASDTNIPPWLFDFLEDRVFPLIKEAFSEAIENLPADSETRSGLQEWLSRTTLEQLGVSNLEQIMDNGGESWTIAISNLVHEIHHNILNHSVWKRFSGLGNESAEYNLLDEMEEGLTHAITVAHRNDDVYLKLAENMADFILSTLKRIISSDKNDGSGNLLSQNWEKIDDHLAQIAGEEMGVKDSAKKILFLKEVFKTFKNNNNLESFSNKDIFSIYNKKLIDSLASAILQVWSEWEYGSEEYRWDFLTGDDEKLLIDLMRKLDDRSGELLNLWRDSKKEHFNEALAVVEPCLKKSLSGY